MSDNAFIAILLLGAMLCMTTCSVSDDWKKVHMEQAKCMAPGKLP